MDPRLRDLITAYQRAVRWAVAELDAAGISRPVSNDAWASADIPGRGELRPGVRYFKHGYGCAVSSGAMRVDFDFGAAGEIDGFDLRRLWHFAQANADAFGFSSEHDLELSFNAALSSGHLQYSGYILYYIRSHAALPS